MKKRLASTTHRCIHEEAVQLSKEESYRVCGRIAHVLEGLPKHCHGPWLLRRRNTHGLVWVGGWVSGFTGNCPSSSWMSDVMMRSRLSTPH